jgi:hypothetical protein
MLLEESDIQELKQIHMEEFGEALSDDGAMDMGRRLLELYRLFCLFPKPDSEVEDEDEQ